MGKRFWILILPLLCCLQSCSPVFLNRDYISEQVHEEQGSLSADGSVLRADSYETLVSAILQLVSQHIEQGVVRLYNYPGDVGEDLAKACLTVKLHDPLGAYAVDYMTHSYTRIVSYYELNITITYRRSYEQIRNIISATGASAIQETLRETLEKFSSYAVLQISHFEENETDIQALLRAAYDETPEAAFGQPDCQVSLYPETGMQRIVEVTLTYGGEQEVLLRQQEQIIRIAASLTENLTDTAPAEMVQEIYQRLRDRIAYGGEKTEKGTIYAALLERNASSEGVAMAVSLLCQTAGFPCEAVRGTRNGAPWVWNRMTLDGQEMDADVTAAILARSDAVTLVPAGQLGEAYGQNSGAASPGTKPELGTKLPLLS